MRNTINVSSEKYGESKIYFDEYVDSEGNLKRMKLKVQ